MYESAIMLGLYAETPVHPGSGAVLGAIDLPVQRERHTNFPVLASSSVKGVWRDEADSVTRDNLPLPGAETADTWNQKLKEVFGPEVKAAGGSGASGDDHGGAISPTDGRLLLFPARSLKGVFVWTTCPYAIERFKRDASLVTPGHALQAAFTVAPGQCWVESTAVVTSSVATAPLVLEDDDYSVQVKTTEMQQLRGAIKALLPKTADYAELTKRLETHLVVLNDTDFARLVVSGTDVVTRNRLNERKTTTGDGGNMWVQEYVPSDALFYSLVMAMGSRAPKPLLPRGPDVLTALQMLVGATHMQIGGDESVGRGWMRKTWVKGF